MDSHMVLSVWFYTNIFQSSWPRSFGTNFMLMTGQFTHCRKKFCIWCKWMTEYKMNIVRKIILSCLSFVLLFPPSHLSAIYFSLSKFIIFFFSFQENHTACIDNWSIDYLDYYQRARWGDLEPKANGEGNEYNSYRVKKFGNLWVCFPPEWQACGQSRQCKTLPIFVLSLSLPPFGLFCKTCLQGCKDKESNSYILKY